jgi:hypothetical protein
MPCCTEEELNDIAKLSKDISKTELARIISRKIVPLSGLSQAATSRRTQLFLLEESSSHPESNPSPVE